MLVTPLGIGAALCTAPYGYSGLLIDRRIMVDAVPQCDIAMRHLGLRADDLDAMLITHFDPDHLLGFPLFIPGRSPDNPLPVYGPVGTAKILLHLCMTFGMDKKLNRVRFIELPVESAGPFDLGDYQFSIAPMRHQPESIAYSVIDKENRILVISGDTMWNDALAGMLSTADAAVVEMTFLQDGHGDHMSLEKDLPKLLGSIKTGCIVLLTHLGSARKEYLDGLEILAAQLEIKLRAKLDNVAVAEELRDYEL